MLTVYTKNTLVHFEACVFRKVSLWYQPNVYWHCQRISHTPISEPLRGAVRLLTNVVM